MVNVWIKKASISSISLPSRNEIYIPFSWLWEGPVTCITNRIGQKSRSTSFWVQVLRNSSFYFLSFRTLVLGEEADYPETACCEEAWGHHMDRSWKLRCTWRDREDKGYRGARHVSGEAILEVNPIQITDEHTRWTLSKFLTHKIVNKIKVILSHKVLEYFVTQW